MTQAPHHLRLPDGRRLAYDLHGPADGLPVFYFHGSPSARQEPGLFALPAVAGRVGVRLVVPDRPGTGDSDFLPGRRLGDWPEDVVALADHLGVERFGVLGYSGGGPYALVCAARIPGRVLAAATVSGTGPFGVPGLAAGIHPDSLRFMRLSVERPFLHGLVSLLMGLLARWAPGRLASQAVRALPDPDARLMSRPELGERFARLVAAATRGGLRGPTCDTALMVGPWDFDLASVAVPVLLWHGEADANAPVAMGRYLADQLPEARATFVPGEGHLSLFATQAEAILRALTEVCHARVKGAG